MKLRQHLSKRLLIVILLAAFSFKLKAAWISTGAVAGNYSRFGTIIVNFSSSESTDTGYLLQVSTSSDMQNPIYIGGNDKSPIIGNLSTVPGGVYYARVIGSKPGIPMIYGSISGTFTVKDGSSQANAINLGNINSPGNVYNKTITCNNSMSWLPSSSFGQPSKEIWFRFHCIDEFSSEQYYQINTCGSSIDTYLYMVKTGAFWRQNDDQDMNPPAWVPDRYKPQCGNTLISSLSTCTDISGVYYPTNMVTGQYFTPGDDIYLVVEGYANDHGPITININLRPGHWHPFAPVNPSSVSNANSTEFALRVAPNPFTNITTLKVEGSTEKTNIEITTINGAVIYKNERYQAHETITLGEDFPAGVYFVRVNNANESKVLKLVKVN